MVTTAYQCPVLTNGEQSGSTGVQGHSEQNTWRGREVVRREGEREGGREGREGGEGGRRKRERDQESGNLGCVYGDSLWVALITGSYPQSSCNGTCAWPQTARYVHPLPPAPSGPPWLPRLPPLPRPPLATPHTQSHSSPGPAVETYSTYTCAMDCVLWTLDFVLYLTAVLPLRCIYLSDCILCEVSPAIVFAQPRHIGPSAACSAQGSVQGVLHMYKNN